MRRVLLCVAVASWAVLAACGSDEGSDEGREIQANGEGGTPSYGGYSSGGYTGGVGGGGQVSGSGGGGDSGGGSGATGGGVGTGGDATGGGTGVGGEPGGSGGGAVVGGGGSGGEPGGSGGDSAGGSGGNGTGGDLAGQPCTFGENRQCTGPTGCSGVQTCTLGLNTWGACQCSATGGSGGGGTGGVGTGGDDGLGLGGTAGAITSCPGYEQVAGSNPLIDDLEDGDEFIPWDDNRRGAWYTYNDGSPGAVQNPTGLGFAPTGDGANSSSYSARTWGSGFASWAPGQGDNWGAGLGVSLNVQGRYHLTCAYDASRYDGISFYAKGSGVWRLEVTSVPTMPMADGGTCPGPCYDHFGTNVTVGSQWQLHQIAWGELLQAGWGDPASFSPREIIGIQLLFRTSDDFDLYLDDLSFY